MYQLLIAFIISISVVLAATSPPHIDRGVVDGGGVRHGGVSVDPGREGVKRYLFGENGHGILRPPLPSAPSAFDRGIKGVPTASLIKGKDSIAYGGVKHGGVHMAPPTTPTKKLTRVLRPGENGHGIIKQPPAIFDVNGGVIHHGGAHLDPELSGRSPNIHHDPTLKASTKDQGKMPRGAKISLERFVWVNDDADDQQAAGDDDSNDDGDDFEGKLQFEDDFISQLIDGFGDDAYYSYNYDDAAADDEGNGNDDANNDDPNVGGGDDAISTILSLQSFMTSFFSPRSPLPRSSAEGNLRGSSGDVVIFSSYSSSSSPGSMFVSYFPSDADRKSSATPCDFMPAQKQTADPVLTSVDASSHPTTEMEVQSQQVAEDADFFDQYGLYLAFATGLMFSAAVSSFLYYSRTAADISKAMPVKGGESNGKLECQSSISDVADPSKFLFAIKSVPVQPLNVDGK